MKSEAEVKERNVDIEMIASFLEDSMFNGIVGARTSMAKDHMVVPFKELLHFNPDLTDYLLERPDDFLKLAENLILNNYSDNKKLKRFALRVPLPEDNAMMVRELRSRHLGKFIIIKGVVKNKSPVMPKIISSRFECPSCGKILNILQTDKNVKQPRMCTCGRKGTFKVLDNEMYDGFTITLEESPEELIGELDTMLKQINVFIKEDLASRQIERMVFLGARVAVSGILKEMPKEKENRVLNLYLEANYIKVDEEFSDLKISDEEKRLIHQLADRSDILEYLATDIYKGVYGYDMEKRALILSIFGGSKSYSNEIKTRSDIHILFIGDPGTNKSQFLKITQAYLPRGRYCAGKGASSAGLTATVVKDELIGGWTVQAGELPLANKGVLLIDEFDKIDKADQQALHEAMEQQTCTISKATIHVQLTAETTIIAAANPKFGRFSGFENLYKEFDIMPAIIDRFDFIFPMVDHADDTKDRQIARMITRRHQQTENTKVVDGVSKLLFRKYVVTAKRLNPTLSDAVSDEIENFYSNMRGKKNGSEFMGVSPRAVNSLIRIAQACARMKLSPEVTLEHIGMAKDLYLYWIKKVGYDKDNPGVFDLDIVSSANMSHSTRNKIEIVLSIIGDMEKTHGKEVPVAEVCEIAKEKGIEGHKVDEIIEKLYKEGVLYQPRSGLVRRL